MDKVTYETLLNLPGSYIVVAYQADCPNCEKLKDSVAKYIKYANKNDDAMKIYAINVNLAINKKMLLKQTESYPSGMLNSKDYKNIKVKATPSIMVINNKTLVKVISDYNTQTPVTDGNNYFKELMK
jgi:thiol-disulfide isomerase/thioredoxin